MYNLIIIIIIIIDKVISSDISVGIDPAEIVIRCIFSVSVVRVYVI